LYSISCPERNFVTIGSNDCKLGLHVSGNDWKCGAQELQIYFVPFLNNSPLFDFYRAFVVRSITLSPYVRTIPYLVCMFLAMT